MKHTLEGINFANLLQNFRRKKISRNIYLENSIVKFAKLCACKSLI